ncbi:hypothetical protein [Roseateles sp.]|uniref:hypothetical protein n=1 Tax=Roseateles sp. TaxID=1971397 RepID=UPI0032653F14
MSIAPLIRPAQPEDAATLAAFAAQAFTDTYRGLDDPQEIADYVAEHFPPEVVAGVIRDPACTTLLAWVGEQLAGYAVLRAAPAPGCVTGPEPLQLWRLYLGLCFIGQGLGARLMAEVNAARRGAVARARCGSASTTAMCVPSSSTGASALRRSATRSSCSAAGSTSIPSMP